MARTATQSLVLSLLLVAGCSSSDSPTGLPPTHEAPVWTTIGAGSRFTCGLRSTGEVYCWGLNDLGQLGAGQLGDGTQTASAVPVLVTGGLQFTALAVGSDHACGLVQNGTAYCWGLNRRGALGAGLDTDPPSISLNPTQVAGGHRFIEISAGLATTCGVATKGVTYCWGANDVGQVGDGTVNPAGVDVPTAVRNSSVLGLHDVSTGFTHACGFGSSGEFFCWGAENAIGNGKTKGNVLQPTLAANGRMLTFQDQGDKYGCGIDASGRAFCWGRNFSGGLGNGTVLDSSEPVQVAGGLTFRSIDANIGNSIVPSTCGLTTSNEAYCWGLNDAGQLGATSNDICTVFVAVDWPCAHTPVMASGGIRFQSVSTGLRHTCGIDLEGSAWCWGLNDNGQLGDGTTVERMTPARVLEP